MNPSSSGNFIFDHSILYLHYDTTCVYSRNLFIWQCRQNHPALEKKLLHAILLSTSQTTQGFSFTKTKPLILRREIGGQRIVRNTLKTWTGATHGKKWNKGNTRIKSVWGIWGIVRYSIVANSELNETALAWRIAAVKHRTWRWIDVRVSRLTARIFGFGK
jgi:hypothetical protein